MSDRNPSIVNRDKSRQIATQHPTRDVPDILLYIIPQGITSNKWRKNPYYRVVGSGAKSVCEALRILQDCCEAVAIAHPKRNVFISSMPDWLTGRYVTAATRTRLQFKRWENVAATITKSYGTKLLKGETRSVTFYLTIDQDVKWITLHPIDLLLYFVVLRIEEWHHSTEQRSTQQFCWAGSVYTVVVVDR